MNSHLSIQGPIVKALTRYYLRDGIASILCIFASTALKYFGLQNTQCDIIILSPLTMLVVS